MNFEIGHEQILTAPYTQNMFKCVLHGKKVKKKKSVLHGTATTKTTNTSELRFIWFLHLQFKRSPYFVQVCFAWEKGKEKT